MQRLNPFWRNTRTEKHHPDPLDPPTPPTPPTPEVRSSRSCTCGFCDAVLAPNGDVLRMGARSKKLRDLEDEFEKLQTKMQTLQAEFDAYRTAHPVARVVAAGDRPRNSFGF
jgi:hypothetical protein